MKRIIICPDDFKKNKLTQLYNKQVINEDFYINLEQLKERLFFEIDSNAKLFARDFLKVKYSVACSLLENIYYIDNDFKHENLEKLRELKKELVNNNLLIFDDLFPFYLKRHDVEVMGYSLSKKDMLLINEVKKYTNVKIHDIKYEYQKLVVNKYNTIEMEIDDTFKKVIELINKGVDINNIKFTNVDSSYTHLLKRYSSFYNLKLNIKKDDSLLGSTVVNSFLNLYKDNKNLIEVMDVLKEKYSNNDIFKKIVNLINEQRNIENDLTDVFLFEFERMKFDELRYDKAIDIVDFYNYNFNDSDHVFVLNFNSKVIPKEFKDDGYLSDYISSNINIDTTLDKINIELEKIKIKLFSIKNIVISFKESSKSKEFMPSRLVETLKMEVVESINNNEYSTINAKMNVSIMLEEFIKFDIFNEEINKYYYLIKDLFNSYLNDYTKVDFNLIKERLEDKIKLSYTSLSTYYKCSFAYYLERVLKININDGNFYSDLGTVFHEILENMDVEGYNYLDEIENNKIKFKTNSELFFYEKLSKQFIDVLPLLKEQKDCTTLKSERHEEKVISTSKGLLNREFIGLVDKVIYREVNDKTYLAVIDYKTGNVNASLDNVSDGFNLQLPIYAYMLKRSTSFKNPIILGMFLQQILNKIPNYDSKEKYNEQIKDDLKLKGYVVGEDNLDILDKTYEKSKMISGLKMNSNNTKLYHHSKVMTEDEFDELAILVENLIDKTFENIEQLKFDINPKMINNVNKSCEYCKYDSICFMKHQDKVNLQKNNFLKKADDENGLD